jgi:hypothetical protein
VGGLRQRRPAGRLAGGAHPVQLHLPGGSQAARILFNCTSTPARRPRYVIHASGDPADAERDLCNMDDAGVIELFKSSEELA